MTHARLTRIEDARPAPVHITCTLVLGSLIMASLVSCMVGAPGSSGGGSDPGGTPAGGTPGGGAPGGPGGSAPGGGPSGGARPIALVYRGPAGCDGCSEAVGAVLQSSRWAFDVKYVGPSEALKISPATLATATLYAQPGGTPSVDDAWTMLQADAPAITSFVRGGGRYLGFCEGGYLAGATPGFGFLPGDTDQYITSRGASVTTDVDTVIPITWRGHTRSMYFQDGPQFIVNPGSGATTIATYSNGEIAALDAPYGTGKVGVVGPHPEADASWYADYGLTDSDGPDADLAHDLIDAVMQ